MVRRFFMVSVLILLSLFPIKALAVDFTIPKVDIKVNLHEDGVVDVTETHTYSFEGKFNGITREIIPPNGAEISGFLANEGENALKVKKEDHVYKIFRKGNSEDIKVRMHYTIKNGTKKYQDLVEFYWPFFDQRNESDYGRMTIVVYPPASTDKGIALGYGEAYSTESVGSDGKVTFQLGHVEAGENGDIRVAYDAALFSGMRTTEGTSLKPILVKEQNERAEKEAAFIRNQNRTSQVAAIVLPIISAIMLLVSGLAYVKSKRKMAAVNRVVMALDNRVPAEKISMPATIYLSDGFTSEGLASALLATVRKGYVIQLSEDEFLRADAQPVHEHEKILLSWLFDEVGSEGRFKLSDLHAYVEKEGSASTYTNKIGQWRKAVDEEVKQSGIYEVHSGLRLFMALTGLAMIPLAIVIASYELYGWMSVAIILAFYGILFSLVYKPISFHGWVIKKEWHQFWLRYPDISANVRAHWTEDERLRVIIHAAGTGRKDVPTNGKWLDGWKRETGYTQNDFLHGHFLVSPLYLSTFTQADEKVSQIHSTNSSGSGSTGGGVGGGGGGSGAF